MRKRLLSTLLALAMALTLLPGTALAAEAPSGKCGDNASWSYNASTGTLTISGTGAMYDYESWGESDDTAPWISYHTEITSVIIEEGITHIGDYAFGDLVSGGYYERIASVSLPKGLISIGEWAFRFSPITSLTLPDSLQVIEGGALAGTEVSHFYIPASVRSIGYYTVESSGWSEERYRGALNGSNLESIEVDPKNPYYTAIDGILYDKNVTEIVTYPTGSPITDYRIPDTITEELDISFFWTIYNLESITVPSNVTLLPNNGGSLDAYTLSDEKFPIYFEGEVPEYNDDWSWGHIDTKNSFLPAVMAADLLKAPSGEEYSITYRDASGEGTNMPASTKCTAGESFKISSTIPTRPGYTFAGWSDGTNTYQPGDSFTMPEKNITLTAVWEADAPSLRFTGQIRLIEPWGLRINVGMPDGTTQDDIRSATVTFTQKNETKTITAEYNAAYSQARGGLYYNADFTGIQTQYLDEPIEFTAVVTLRDGTTIETEGVKTVNMVDILESCAASSAYSRAERNVYTAILNWFNAYQVYLRS